MKITWSPEMEDALGKNYDVALAGHFKLPIKVVTARRVSLGIKRYKPPAQTPKGKPKYNISPIEWTAELDKMLGTKSDAKLALEFDNRAPDVIRKRRLGLKIESFGDRQRRMEDEARSKKYQAIYQTIEWPPQLLAELGKRIDSYLAGLFDVPGWAIERKRNELGIVLAPFSHLYEGEHG